MEINTLEKDLEEAVVLAAADSLDASSLKSSKELVSSNMKGKLDSIGDNLMPCFMGQFLQDGKFGHFVSLFLKK